MTKQSNSQPSKVR